MKHIPFLFFFLSLFGCSSSQSPEPESPLSGDSSVLIKASGLSESVTLFESISKQTHIIESDGNHEITLPENQSIYSLSIIDSPQQYCELSNDLDLACNIDVCDAQYLPVCAKKPLAGLTCATEPCQTDRYLTFGNRCEAFADNAWIALDSECDGLEDQVAYHLKPIYITNFTLIDVYADPYNIIETNLQDDSLTIKFEVSGGCGSHRFTLYGNDIFLESFPVQQTNAIGYDANDVCDSIIQIEETFDLLPIKEVYRRAYPEAAGQHTVILNSLAEYTFTIE